MRATHTATIAIATIHLGGQVRVEVSLGCGERYNDRITNAQAPYAFTNFGNISNALVAKDPWSRRAGVCAAVDMQVRTTDGSSGELDDGICGIDECRTRNIRNGNVVSVSFPENRTHSCIHGRGDIVKSHVWRKKWAMSRGEGWMSRKCIVASMGMYFICLRTSKDLLAAAERSHHVVSDDSHQSRPHGTRGPCLLRFCHDVEGGDKSCRPIAFASNIFLAG